MLAELTLLLVSELVALPPVCGDINIPDHCLHKLSIMALQLAFAYQRTKYTMCYTHGVFYNRLSEIPMF